MSDTDLELLARYTRHQAEEAFAEIVRRHLDLVHSAALRQVRSPQLAEEVAQSTFVKLAQHARQLAPDTILSAWLYQVTRREAIDVVRREARRQLREQIATEMNAMNATAADWTHIEPLLDEAMHALDETDRAAVLLRYFEKKSLREVGQALGASENAAQKRLTRAVEHLREFFAQRGVTVGTTSGLLAVIGTNAVQAAPVGLALTISTAVSLAGTTVFTAATATTAKAIAMTTLQKSLVTAALVVTSVTAIYEARQAAVWRAQYVELHDQAADQIQQLQRERDEAITHQVKLEPVNEQSPAKQTPDELLRLRGEVSRLKAALAQRELDPTQAAAAEMAAKVSELKEWLARTPDETIPELEILTPRDWFFRVLNVPPGSRNEWTASLLRTDAKRKFVEKIGPALAGYLLASQGQLPNDIAELNPYFKSQVDDAILQRYELLHAGHLRDFPEAEPIVGEKAPNQRGQYDAIFKIGAFGYSYHRVDSTGESGSGSFHGYTKELRKLREKE